MHLVQSFVKDNENTHMEEMSYKFELNLDLFDETYDIEIIKELK